MIVFQTDSIEGRSYLCVIIEKTNLDRMEQGDPITLSPVEIGGLLLPIQHPAHLYVLICYEQDMTAVSALLKSGDNAKLIEYLMRGYRFRKGTDGVRKGADAS